MTTTSTTTNIYSVLYSYVQHTFLYILAAQCSKHTISRQTWCLFIRPSVRLFVRSFGRCDGFGIYIFRWFSNRSFVWYFHSCCTHAHTNTANAPYSEFDAFLYGIALSFSLEFHRNLLTHTCVCIGDRQCQRMRVHMCVCGATSNRLLLFY